MKITIIGAGGNIGQRITTEATKRGYELNLITSKSLDFFSVANATAKAVDIFNQEELTKVFKNTDVVISAYAPPHSDVEVLSKATTNLITAAKNSNTRLIAVGGAGSLKVAEDLLLIDAPAFPSEYKAIAKAHINALEIYKQSTDVNWTNVSPSAYIFEGERTNNFKIGTDYLIANDKQESSISMEDFAVAIINEVEESKFEKQRFTVGY